MDAAPGFTVAAEIAVQRGAVSGIAISPDGALLTVTHYGDAGFSLIDTASGVVAGTVIDIDEPFAVAMSDEPAGRAYLSSVSGAFDAILAFDTDTSSGRCDLPRGIQRDRPGGESGRAARLRRPGLRPRRRCRDP